MFSIGLQTVKDRIFWLFIFLLSLLKLIICNSIPLTPDELQYCAYSQFLSLSYFDHPPTIAYILKFFELIFDNINLTPRICSSVIILITAYIFYCFIKKSTKSIIISQLGILTFYSTPMLVPLEMTTDIPLLLFFILSIYFFYCFIESNKNRYLIFFSVSLGLGLLSKYTMFLVLPAVMLFCIISKENRFILKSKKIYLGFLLSFCIFLPVVIWNLKFDNCSFIHTFNNLFNNSERMSMVNRHVIDVILQFCGSQLIYYNPILTFIHKNILFDIIRGEYCYFIKYYGIIYLFISTFIYTHLFLLYKKTKQNVFLVVFCFSLLIWIVCFFCSFKAFPVEYCARAGIMLLCFYLAYICNKKLILRFLLIGYCIFGIYISLLEPVYFMYGMNSKININNSFKIENNFFIEKTLSIIKKYSNQIDFISSTNLQEVHTLNYYFNKKFKVVYLFKCHIYYFWNQNLHSLKDKNCILFIKDDLDLIEEIKNRKIFNSIEKLSGYTYFCKSFNFEKYRQYYFDCHYELKN